MECTQCRVDSAIPHLPYPVDDKDTMYPSCFLVLSSAKSGSPIRDRRMLIRAALRAVVCSI